MRLPTNFQTREIPWSGSTAKNEEKEKKEKKEKKEEERLNDDDNNGQAMHGARKHAWRTQATWAKNHEGPGVVVWWGVVFLACSTLGKLMKRNF